MLITKEGMESEVEEIRNIANFLRSNSTPILRYFYRRERVTPRQRLLTKTSSASSASITVLETPTSFSTESPSTSPESLSSTKVISIFLPLPAHQNAN